MCAKLEKVFEKCKQRYSKKCKELYFSAQSAFKYRGFAKNIYKYLFVPDKCITFAVAIKKYRGVEQLVARQAHNLEVTRSSRVSATNIAVKC